MGKPKGGDQTEKPTPKRLKDARKEGEVHRSQELTNTLLLMLWLAMAPLLAGWVYQHLADAFEASFIGVGQHRPADLLNTLQLDLMLLMRAVLPLLIFASVVGIAADFLQVGPLFALKRLVPKMERINPVEGVKRMFSQENLVEVFKSIFKSAALLGIGVLVLRAMLPPILSLPDASPPDILHAWWRSLMWIGIYVMYPVILDTHEAIEQRGQELPEQKMDLQRMLDLVGHAKEPLREFLIAHSSDTERAFFLESARRFLPDERRQSLGPRDYIVVVPAFTVSELTAAFQIGFLIFLPFLIIDLMVSNILLALGMMMLSPTLVSLPFKLLLFVFMDGWAKLVHGLVLTYG